MAEDAWALAHLAKPRGAAGTGSGRGAALLQVGPAVPGRSTIREERAFGGLQFWRLRQYACAVALQLGKTAAPKKERVSLRLSPQAS